MQTLPVQEADGEDGKNYLAECSVAAERYLHRSCVWLHHSRRLHVLSKSKQGFC